MYRNNCSPVNNHRLATVLIRVDPHSVYTKESMELGHAANNNNTFSLHCPNQLAPSSTSSSPTGNSGGTTTAAISVKSQSRGTLICGVIGGALGLISLAALAAIVWMRMHKRAARSNRSQWSGKPRVGSMDSLKRASAVTREGSIATPGSEFSTEGRLSSPFPYRIPDLSLSRTGGTSQGSWTAVSGSFSCAPSSPTRVDLSTRLDDSEFAPPSIGSPDPARRGLFSAVYGTGSTSYDSERTIRDTLK
ncbi:hypothetical protein GSI_09821 [Ganoderma sinense ZZ0214-1]|uniref:Uncharacterized protein n=1 Tax=Ganoderma sinense ZZ0214-1 TaxID=1077348 RepID=A0A2G8S3E1_9APHY|nr:hypothetical protein GSI_09821 [Ganoderma sinense ZZ0214-1]